MAKSSEKLAESLVVLKSLQQQGKVAIRALDMTRTHRERLLKNGFIREVMKGWYVPSRPDEPPGESTAWYTSFWKFCAAYLNERFGIHWCLSAEQSISLHTGNWNVPRQLLVRTSKGGNKPTSLLFGTSIFDLRLELPSKQDMEVINGLRVFNLPASLLSCSPSQFATRPVETRAALAMVQDASTLLRTLLTGGHSKIAGRLAGALRNIGRDQMADNITETMRAAGFTISENDPFEDRPPILFNAQETSPHVNRMRINWTRMRKDVLRLFPAAPGLAKNISAYMKKIDAVYVGDAYNSLSIEGYKVSAELIERVRSGKWDPVRIIDHQDERNALAARGYWLAFQSVKQSIKKILQQENAGKVAEKDHASWYRELFAPSVTAGILKPSDLAGYRNEPVYIRRSMYAPPRAEAVRDLIPAFFDLLQQEDEPAVRVVLGHFMFVYIHPYFDGNGRMGRFLMNVMLAAGGYPWTIVPLEQRNKYLAALESASVNDDIKPFCNFIAGLIQDKL